MEKILNWMMAAILTCGLTILSSCSTGNEDNPVSPQPVPQPEKTLQVGSYVWGSTVYNMGTDGAARLAEAYQKAGIQHAILLIKDEKGTVSYARNTLSNAPKSRSDRDILTETVSAMHERGIKVYAWLTAGKDESWLKAHPEQGSYHFRRGYSDSSVDLNQVAYREYMGKVMTEIEQNYDIDGFAIDQMRYQGIYYGWSDSDYQRLTTPKAEGGYGLTLDEYNELVTLLCKQYNYPATPDTNGRLVYSADAEAPGTTSGIMSSSFRKGVAGVVAFAKMREMAVDSFSEFLVRQTTKPVYVASMAECTYDPTEATLSYGMTFNQAYTFDVVCPMLYSIDYGKDALWVARNIGYLKDLGYKTVMPSLQAYRSADTESLADDISASVEAGCPGYLLFRTGTYDMARCVKTADGKLVLSYIRGTDYNCGNITVTVSGVTPNSVTMGGKLSATKHVIDGQSITFQADALEKLGDYGTVTIQYSGSGQPSVSVASDVRIVYNAPML